MKQLKVTVNGKTYDVVVEEVGAAPAAAPATSAPAAPVAPAVPAGEGEPITAPMPGTVLKVLVSAGQSVKRGDNLLILEAMKMENEISAPKDGVVASVAVASGDAVESGRVLLTLK